jgi:hypothetical protein
METVRGIVDHNSIRLVTPLPLPEGSEIEFEPRLVVASPPENALPTEPLQYSEEGLRQVYAILSERYDSGFTDTAARHNEHQP